MKVEVTLTSDEYAALSTAPGKSAPQRLRWLIRFWAATKAEHDKTRSRIEVEPQADPLRGIDEGASHVVLP